MAAADTSAQHPREFEIKLEFDPADRALIEAHPLLQAARPERETLTSVYFDTQDLALRKAQLALRVRKAGPRYIQTLKAMDGAAQLFDRPEWEHETSGFAPDLNLIASTPLEALLNQQGGGNLQAVFRTRVDRSIYRLPAGETDVEVAIDQGEIEAAERWSAVHEVELELKHGDAADVFRLARRLAGSLPLRLAVKTKAERGYDLAEGVAPGAEKAQPLALAVGMSCAQAFRAIGENCLRQIVANERVVGTGDAEGLHQMRIGLRRLRAAIAVFSKMLADPELERIKAELKWIGGELGPARDLDVFVADVLQPLAKGGEHADTRQAFDAARAKVYATAGEAIRSDRFRNALLDMAEWIEVGPWTLDETLRKARARKVEKHAAKRLSRMRDHLRDVGKSLNALDAKRRHKLRIRAKNLRYAIEFFAGLFPDAESAKRREAQLSALKDLQDELGALNDLAQRETLADRHGLGPQAATLLAAEESEIAKRLKRAEAAHASFAKVKSFWS